ncbi:hypothetical protein [Methanomethylovorans sp.]|uniref:hypothetical protein n=1 Tax=Methanomethylovorans sp. TaxID=2758717 RepID=UPI00351C91B1
MKELLKYQSVKEWMCRADPKAFSRSIMLLDPLEQDVRPSGRDRNIYPRVSTGIIY